MGKKISKKQFHISGRKGVFLGGISFGLLVLAIIFIISTRKSDESPASVDNFAGKDILSAEATPPPEPGGPITPMIYIDGEKVYLGMNDVPLWYAEKMGYLDKIAQAEYLGETGEPVADSEAPTEELQTNCLPAGYQVYHYVTEGEDSYLICSEEDDWFLYMENWEVSALK